MLFRDHEDKSADCYVAEDGSAGYLKDGYSRKTHRSFIPAECGWSDWPRSRSSPERPAVMFVSEDKIPEIRAEIARRWTDLMNCYVKYNN